MSTFASTAARAVEHEVRTPPTDFAAVKRRQQAAWASGDYAVVGTTLQIVGETLAEAVDLSPGSKVLDVAAGNGNATLAFARRGCDVVSTDYVPALLDRARERAVAERLAVTFREADAEALPFADESFDGVISTFGVMFAPIHAKAAAELVRVCRSGGRIGLANWTPESFIGEVFRTIGRHIPPPPGLSSPALWGSDGWIEQTFRSHARSIHIERRAFVFRYRSPAHFLEVFRTFYGPVHKAFLSLDQAGRDALEADLLATIARFNTARDGSARISSDYAEIVITRN